ncbi:FAD-dependent oxidoreductase [Paraburkholderia sp. D1E]|uniref:FAD-dependent oxidoreductase n=1 Tax=Paraburkholderia sp. D1E TaxID=3461398 RepID=UPI0040464C46
MKRISLRDAVGEPAPYDVAICGGGPVGLALAYLLGRENLRVVLFEKRCHTTQLPKGQFVHASTAELYRQWGVWDLLDGAGWSIDASNGQGYYVRVALGPVAEIRQSSGIESEYVEKWQELSPVYPRKIPASDYEAALYRQAARWSCVSLRFGHEVVEVTDTGEAVHLLVREASGEEYAASALYLVACDGARSFVRSQLGRGEDHGPTFGNQILTEFEADLDASLGQDGFFHSFVLDPRYAGWFGSQHPETGYWRYSFRHDEEQLPDSGVVLARIRGALGMPHLPVKVVKTWRFDYTTGLLRSWREGRVFFAGDAAHWHSPWGGYGANIGVQDANNLAWKLALVIRRQASSKLLDTYEAERKPKAELAVKAATYNSLNFQALIAATLVGEPEASRSGKLSPRALAFLREGVERHGANSVLHTGFQFGATYDSSAVIRDGAIAPPSTLSDYKESTVPGVRAPHVWLKDRNGRIRSTVDLWGTGFVLLIQHETRQWGEAVVAVGRETGVAIRLITFGSGGEYLAVEPRFSRLYSLDHGNALLIRPDGFIGRRLRLSGADQSSTTDAVALLRATLRNVLCVDDGYLTLTDAEAVERVDG